MFRAAFFKGTHPGLSGMFNRFVRFWTHSKYSHMEIVFSDGRCASSSFLDGGVRFKTIDLNENDWDFIELPDSLEMSALEWFKTHDGKAYDYWADLRLFLFGPLPDSKDKWMCSEACLSSLGFTSAWQFNPGAAYSAVKMLH